MKCLSLLVLYVAPILTNPQSELLEFSAKWCGPCQQIAPIVDRLHRQGYPIRKVDIDEQRDLARRFGIQSIPAFVLVVNGRIVEQAAGVQSEQRIMQMLAKIPRPRADFDSSRNDAPVFANSNDPTKLPSTSPRFLPASNNDPAAGAVSPLVARTQEPRPASSAIQKNPKSFVARAKVADHPLVLESKFTRDPMLASTRLRISDPTGINLGSGTIIDSRAGQTLILTCGHIFRDFKADSMVEVDVFINGKKETYVGKAIKFDLTTDLGLVSIPTDSPLPYSRIAAISRPATKGAAVQSVGCGQGNDPTLQKHMVTRLNRYQGPDNVECTGVPVLGRSGGGLFNEEGEVIGICMAADEEQRRGLYLGLRPILRFLHHCQTAKLILPCKNFPEIDEEVPPANPQTPPAQIEDELPSESDSLLVSNPPPKGLQALKLALGDDITDDVVCIVNSKKTGISQNQRKVVVFSGKAN